jgi:methanogenic corrinoid protein MtbC1
MYTISQAAARTGLSVPTIRAWERRYGIVRPSRTASGYRLYDDAAISLLIAMRQLVEREGFRPGQAADRIRAVGSATDTITQEPTPVSSPLPAADSALGGTAVDAFLDATGRLDIPAMERLLDEAFAAGTFESAVEHMVFPALRRIGDLWSDGTLDVAMEHAASETIRRRLVRFYDAAETRPSGPSVLVGLAPGAWHELGALAFAVAARRRGVEVVYLGANVPVDSWLAAAESSGATIAVVGAPEGSDPVAIGEVVEALGESAHRPTVALGGAMAPAIADRTGAIGLPERIDEAARLVTGWVPAR